MKKIFLLFIAAASVFIGCKKYEDGPIISLRSSKNRLLGQHTLIKYTVDGVDSLESYHDSLGIFFDFIYDKGNEANYCNITGSRKDGFSGDLYWAWQFYKTKRILLITEAGSDTKGIGPFGDKKTPEWEILRLKKNDVHMKTNYNGKEYYVELN